MDNQSTTVGNGEIISLSQLPQRNLKPRTNGLNIIIDNGIPLGSLDDIMCYNQHIDAIEIGPASVFVTGDLMERVVRCKANNIIPFLSGIVLELFLIRNKLDDYIALCKDNDITTFQVTDGCITVPHAEKCGWIEKLSEFGTVYGRIGSQDAAYIIPPYKWIEQMKAEMEAGAKYVFAESREAGNAGIYRGSGEVREGLVQEILTVIPADKIIWMAPQKSQQLYFIELVGCNCNLANIPQSQLLQLEATRLGLHGSTFHLFLDKGSV